MPETESHPGPTADLQAQHDKLLRLSEALRIVGNDRLADELWLIACAIRDSALEIARGAAARRLGTYREQMTDAGRGHLLRDTD
jgi:hypothetical protein